MRHPRKPNLAPGFWTLADQGVVSLGNFATNIILARSLPSGEYGVFAVIFGVLYLLNSCQYSFISYPLITKGAASAEMNLGRLTSSALALTAVALVPLGGIVFLATVVFRQAAILPWVYVALVCWEMQDTLRRALMAKLRFSTAIWGDMLSYLGQAIIIGIMAQFGSLSLGRIFMVVALTSLLAACIQGVQIGIKVIAFEDFRKLSRGFVEIGKWSLMANVLFALSIQVFPWMLAVHGMSDVAGFQAATNLLAFTNPVAFSIGSVIVPMVAASRGGASSHRRIFAKYALEGASLLVPFYVLLAALPTPCLELLYGSQSPYLKSSLTAPLSILVPAYMLAYIAHVSSSALYGQQRSRDVFRGQALASVSILIGLPLTLWWGVLGAAVGFMFVNACRVLVNCLFIFCKEATMVAAYRPSCDA